MANVNGTSGNDFIHVSGDGQLAPPGYTDNPGATNSDDVINSGNGGSDIIYAGAGDDTINFSSDLGSTDQIAGGFGYDTIVIGGQTSVAFGSGSLSSVEEIDLPFLFLPKGVLGFQDLTMHDSNVDPGQELRIDGSALSADVSFSWDGSAETDAGYTVIGGAGDDVFVGGQNGNFFDLTEGGRDSVTGGADTDIIIFGDTLTAEDHIVAGGGDSIGISGPSYAAGLAFADATLEATGCTIIYSTGFSYHLTITNANVTAGEILAVQPGGLATTNAMYFDGSAEQDSRLNLQGGGGDDTLIGGRVSDFLVGHDGADKINIARGGGDFAQGGAGADKVIANAGFDATDTLDGGTESDTLALDGDFSSGVVFLATTLTQVEKITLADGNDYALTTHDATVAAGQTLTVSGGKLGAAFSLTFNGAAELDGSLFVTGGDGKDALTGGAVKDRLTGGGGKDALNGGSGNDRFIYLAAGDSTSVGYDRVTGANFKADVWDVPNAVAAIDPLIATGHLTVTNFDSRLAMAADAAHLGAFHAVLFTPDSGALAGKTFLVVDQNGAAGYQANADIVVELVGATNLGNIDTTDFI